MAKISVTENSRERYISITEELTIFSASDDFSGHLKNIDDTDVAKIIFDLHGVIEIDTAGMQLLLCVFKHFRERGCHCKIERMSRVVKDFVELFQLESVINQKVPA